MHIMKQVDRLVVVSIVAFRYEYQVRCKFWITKEGLYALNNISQIDLKCLSRYNNFFSFEPWAAG